jgi:hypothetical protein
MFYPDMETGSTVSDRAASATIGIADQDGQFAGRVLQWSFNTASLANGDSLTFRPAGGPLGYSAAWRLTHFGDSAATGQGSDTEDPDHDGLVNLLECALGTNPLHAGGVYWSLVPENGGWKYRYTRPVAARAEGLVFSVEHSLSLAPATWSAAGVTESFTVQGNLEHVTATLPAHASPKCFARLRVKRP